MTRHPAYSIPFIAVFLVAAYISPDANATWSVAAINARTGTIGVAAASCSGGVYGIQAVVPGKGAVIVQAASSNEARQAAVALLRAGAPLDTILAKHPGLTVFQLKTVLYALARNASTEV